MPFLTLSVQHRLTFAEARRRLETAVHELTNRVGPLVRQVVWSTDHSQVRLEGSGLSIELRIDEQAVHVAADVPLLGRLLGGSLSTQLQELLKRTFQQPLPGGNEKTEGEKKSPLR